MITVVIPDTGPLISLARADRLDLIDRFNSPILIADAVAMELRHGPPAAPDRARLEAWLAQSSNRIQIVPTRIGDVLRELHDLERLLAPAQRRAAHRHKRRHAGEVAILEMATALQGRLTAGETGLVLFEDKAVTRMNFGPYVRVMNTWALATILETLGVLDSADILFDAIEATGRSLDRQAWDAIGPGAPDDFLASYDRTGIRSGPTVPPPPRTRTASPADLRVLEAWVERARQGLAAVQAADADPRQEMFPEIIADQEQALVRSEQILADARAGHPLESVTQAFLDDEHRGATLRTARAAPPPTAESPAPDDSPAPDF